MLHHELPNDDAVKTAATLRHASELVTELARRVDDRVQDLHYEGHAAERFRAAMAERSTRAHRIAHQLDAIADTVSAQR
jgi:uncharacterized protein YukE